MRPVRVGAVLLLVLMVGGATIALAGTSGDDHRGDRGKRGWGHHNWSSTAVAVLKNAAGHEVGKMWLRERRGGGGVTVFVRVHDAPPGFHGFHIHTTGICRPPDFMSAGGHLNPGGEHHPNHAGDLPSLLVNEDGTGALAAVTDWFSLADLRDADGSAVIVHPGPDNFANIPARYAPNGPDETTLSTGDSGTRFACGEVR
jgi:superoxide dismutase, Cu-Zn family